MNAEAPDYVGPQMTVLDVVHRFRATEAVFKKWDDKAGECICCQALFDTVRQVADRYGLDLNQLMDELNEATGEAKFSSGE